MEIQSWHVHISGETWHRKGGGENIFPQPVMEVDVKKTKLDESSSPRGAPGVKCLLYEARKHPNYDPVHENTFKSELSTFDPNMGFAQVSEGTSYKFENALLAPF